MKDFYHGSQFYPQTNEEQSNLGKPKVVVLMIACGFWVLLWSSLTKNNYTIIFCLKKRRWSTSFKIGKYKPLCQLKSGFYNTSLPFGDPVFGPMQWFAMYAFFIFCFHFVINTWLQLVRFTSVPCPVQQKIGRTPFKNVKQIIQIFLVKVKLISRYIKRYKSRSWWSINMM